MQGSETHHIGIRQQFSQGFIGSDKARPEAPGASCSNSRCPGAARPPPTTVHSSAPRRRRTVYHRGRC